MSSSKRQGGAPKRANKNKQNKNKQSKNKQQGGSNSSSVALSNAGLTPMSNYKGGSLANNAAQYSGSVSVDNRDSGNVFMKGMSGGNPELQAPNGVPVTGGVLSATPINVPGLVPGSAPVLTGGNVLNDLAVPAVLLYANQAFGKKKNYTSKPSRRFRKNNNKSRRFRRR